MLKLSSIPLAALWLAAFPVLATAATHSVSVVDNRFTPNDITINVGDTVRWTNAAGGAMHDVTEDNRRWNSITATSFTFSHTFNSVEEVLYYCTVHSSDPVPPVANFTSSCTDLACNFTDQSTDSDGSIASRSWDFGDGASSSQRNPAHSYTAAGTFNVELTVTDNDEQSDSTSKNVTVTGVAEDPFLINAAISDAWFFPDTAGQGFFIIVWEESKSIFLSWFTYDTVRPPEEVSAILGEKRHGLRFG